MIDPRIDADLALICRTLPVDPDDGTAVVDYGPDGVPRWGDPEPVALAILEALVAARRLLPKPPRSLETQEDWTVARILASGRRIWGADRMELPAIANCATVVVGDLARAARDITEGASSGDAQREVGNLVVSSVRWADDLGYDVGGCITAALDAQTAYVASRQARCPNCDHPLTTHSAGGCWFTLREKTLGENLVCGCQRTGPWVAVDPKGQQ